jgi:hypothetical protein
MGIAVLFIYIAYYYFLSVMIRQPVYNRERGVVTKFKCIDKNIVNRSVRVIQNSNGEYFMSYHLISLTTYQSVLPHIFMCLELHSLPIHFN